MRQQNRAVLKDTLYKEVYEEIERILPSLEYCLAARKYAQKSGAAALRGSSSSQHVVSAKDPEQLDRHAKVLHEWLGAPVSRIRMLLQWQGAGGPSHCMQTHHRAMTCYRQYGGPVIMPKSR